MSIDMASLPVRKSPKGPAQYPHLIKPDTKWKPEGEYKTGLILEGSDHVAMEKVVDEVMAVAEAEAKKTAKAKKKPVSQVKAADMPFTPEADEEGEETGRYIYKFKSTASGTTKKGGHWERKMPIFDAKGKAVTGLKSIFGGSVIRIAYKAVPWVNPKLEYGVKLQIEAIRLLELKTGGGSRGAGDYGFDDEEEGFEADDAGASAFEGSDDDDAEGFDAEVPQTSDDDEDF
jgi:hypothetical protein